MKEFKLKKIKSSNHHWWPKSLSQHWKGDNGLVYMFSPDGEYKRVAPAQVALIRNGHSIKLSNLPREETAFDMSFESVFDRSDINFSMVITEIINVIREHDADFEKINLSGFFDDDFLCLLVECAVSLAVRSPRYRSKIKSTVERYRGQISNAENKKYIALNMNNKHELIVQGIAKSAAICVLYNPRETFIFGDGFYQNIPVVIPPLNTITIVVPFTPNLTVIVHSGKSRRHTNTNIINVNDSELLLCNSTIQVYSREYIFSKTHDLAINEYFKVNDFLEFNFYDDPIERLVRNLLS